MKYNYVNNLNSSLFQKNIKLFPNLLEDILINKKIVLFIFVIKSFVGFAQTSIAPTTITAPSGCYSPTTVLDPSRTYVIYWGVTYEWDDFANCEINPTSYCGTLGYSITALYAANIQHPINQYTSQYGNRLVPFIEKYPPQKVAFTTYSTYKSDSTIDDFVVKRSASCTSTDGYPCETVQPSSGKFTSFMWQRIKDISQVPIIASEPFCTYNPIKGIEINVAVSPTCTNVINYNIPIVAIYDVTNGTAVLILPDQNCGKCTPILCSDGKASGCTSCDTGCVPKCDACTVQPTIELKN